MPSALAFRYARALAGLTGTPGAPAPEKVLADLTAMEQTLSGSQGLHNALQSPAVLPVKKRSVLARLTKELQISDLVRRFVLVLIEHRRVPLLKDIREAMETVVDEQAGVVRIDVTSARKLTAAQEAAIAAEFARATGKQARARFAVSDSLIGGVTARMGSTVFDGSVRGQLEALKHRLAQAGN